MNGRSAARSGALTVGKKRTRFTVAEADRTLPLVGRIAADVVQQYDRLERVQAQRKALPRRGDPAEASRLEREATEVVDRLNGLLAELVDIGCQLKDLQAGLIDFPSRRNGNDILLCWKLGEPRLAYWHDPSAGFSGRRPIDEACE
ncbi:MAG: DUF2203 domain-containing protein [bacterium]|nr:DUF2203 domain-containing protein [bacterium]